MVEELKKEIDQLAEEYFEKKAARRKLQIDKQQIKIEEETR